MENKFFLFEQARRKVLDTKDKKTGIGTLKEQSIHAVIKNYLEPDEKKQEIKVDKYIVDIKTDKFIIEIQTKNFNKIQQKLDTLLKKYKVILVYPIVITKWIFWINKETGEILKKRKSPKKEKIYQIFPELYKIKEHLLNSNLQLHIILIDLDEYRIVSSQNEKEKIIKYDKIPKTLIDEIDICKRLDYQKFLSDQLKSPFTSLDYSRELKIPKNTSSIMLNILNYLKIVKRIGKKGNSYLYERVI